MLYQWSSISQTAVNLAANMGAKNVILVGCDNCALLDNHHAHAQQSTHGSHVKAGQRLEATVEGLERQAQQAIYRAPDKATRQRPGHYIPSCHRITSTLATVRGPVRSSLTTLPLPSTSTSRRPV